MLFHMCPWPVPSFPSHIFLQNAFDCVVPPVAVRRVSTQVLSYSQTSTNGHLSTTAIFWGTDSPYIHSCSLLCLDANKFVLLSFFSLVRRIFPRVSNKPLPNNAKGPLPVDVRRLTTLLLKLLQLIYNGNFFTMAAFFCPQGGRCREVQLY